jgi:hypothetical protein
MGMLPSTSTTNANFLPKLDAQCDALQQEVEVGTVFFRSFLTTFMT